MLKLFCFVLFLALLPISALGDDSSELLDAVLIRDLARAERLIRTSPKSDLLNSPGTTGWTPLCLAARMGDSQITRLLLQLGAQLDLRCKLEYSLRSSADYSPLLLALQSQDFGTVRTLLESPQMTYDLLTAEIALAQEMRQQAFANRLLSLLNVLKFAPDALKNPSNDPEQGVAPLFFGTAGSAGEDGHKSLPACSICLESLDLSKGSLGPTVNAGCCLNSFCRGCINDYQNKAGANPKCPLCRLTWGALSLQDQSPIPWTPSRYGVELPVRPSAPPIEAQAQPLLDNALPPLASAPPSEEPQVLEVQAVAPIQFPSAGPVPVAAERVISVRVKSETERDKLLRKRKKSFRFAPGRFYYNRKTGDGFALNGLHWENCLVWEPGFKMANKAQLAMLQEALSLLPSEVQQSIRKSRYWNVRKISTPSEYVLWPFPAVLADPHVPLSMYPEPGNAFSRPSFLEVAGVLYGAPEVLTDANRAELLEVSYPKLPSKNGPGIRVSPAGLEHYVHLLSQGIEFPPWLIPRLTESYAAGTQIAIAQSGGRLFDLIRWPVPALVEFVTGVALRPSPLRIQRVIEPFSRDPRSATLVAPSTVRTRSGAIYTPTLHPNLGLAWTDPRGLIWSDRLMKSAGGQTLDLSWNDASQACLNLNDSRDVERLLELKRVMAGSIFSTRLEDELALLGKRLHCRLPSRSEREALLADFTHWGRFKPEVFFEADGPYTWTAEEDELGRNFHSSAVVKSFRCVCSE